MTSSARKPGLRIREVRAEDDSAFKPAYAILARTFHRNERISMRDWRSTLREKSVGVLTDSAWHLLVAERAGQVVGMVTGTYLGNVNVGVVGYLAIAPDTRSGGLGTRLRARLRRAFERDAATLCDQQLTAIVGEVGADNPWLASLARRPAVIVLDFQYFQPSLRADDEPSPFLLYYESTGPERRYLPAAEVRRLLYAIWRRVYRVRRPLDRPFFRKMMRSLEGRSRIGSNKSFAPRPPP